jgi:pimeloyl-ACP methyl ester carboxylesterase
MFGHAEGGRMAMLFAATFPEKTSALVLLDSFARRVRDNDYPWGVPEGFLPRLFERFDEGWGNGGHLSTVGPSVAQDQRFREWYGRYHRGRERDPDTRARSSVSRSAEGFCQGLCGAVRTSPILIRFTRYRKASPSLSPRRA